MNLPRILLGALVVAMTAGCASMQHAKPMPSDQLAQAVESALKAQPSQGLETTVQQLDALAKRNPTSGLPWTHIAKLRFNEEQYGPAIVAADEALQRDPDDFTAKSIRVVGGLRIALQSLADIKDNALLAGNARTDAEALAKAMRESLGQDVLFPRGKRSTRRPAPKPAPTPAEAPAVSQPASSVTPGAQPATTQPAPDAGASGGNRNPFDGLLDALPN